MKAPRFWTTGGLPADLLAPLGSIYGRIVSLRARRAGLAVGVPVLCIGNPTLGGAGKTPTVRALAQILHQDLGHDPHIVTRGYGGRVKTSLRVDPDQHDAALVGDEPLLLAQSVPVWAGPDRVASARAAVAAGADILLLDDGFQNPSLAKTASWLVIDGPAGLGNGRVFPAGPLRERYDDALDRAQALVIIGPDDHRLGENMTAPVIHADLVHPEDVVRALDGRLVLAFAGIGRPEKFFESLASAGVQIAERRAFPDHHPFNPAELADLRAAARRIRAELVTTEKDLVRLPVEERTGIRPIPVTLRWRNHPLVRNLLMRLVTPVSTR
ncbi:MAG TPA: tetraacyldisaccharide 4'-kinase [Geminicoccus sp.]|uniref:tetraacyldisaccharide 4'-kinase n=1 Tax=Geminicoccus sp. TaxID=2024832 RepID=UPI002E36A6DA|nr:tetraacyldisaccharide 4'-kinase [Geminicoccus sp.]HEX2526530.1 tetraacyldisaccharide 4'-kinase [Geminicoccus sp.]